MISAIAPAMVSTYFPAEVRGKAMGYITVVGSLGVALGPTLGGFLTHYAYKRACGYFCNSSWD